MYFFRNVVNIALKETGKIISKADVQPPQRINRLNRDSSQLRGDEEVERKDKNSNFSLFNERPIPKKHWKQKIPFWSDQS